MYTLQYFRDKFAAIPESLWCMGTWHNRHGQSCAMGHCGEHLSEERYALTRLTYSTVVRERRRVNGEGVSDGYIYMVNDDLQGMVFPGKTPKERILNFLDMMIAEQKAKANKELITRVEIIASSNPLSDMIEEAEYELV